MYKKIESFTKIVNLGLNVHRYFIPKTYSEYLLLIHDLKFCTVRTDHNTITADLPFYLVNTEKCDAQYIEDIWNTAQKNEYKLIISDGFKYDNIQEYNLVVKFEMNGDFFFEASELKIPLRHMYRHPLLSCYGNVATEISEWTIIKNKYGLDKRTIKRDLEQLYTYQIYNKWLEVTKYPQGVGIKNEPMVLWQIA